MVSTTSPAPSLKEACEVDLGYPYHLNDTPAAHLAALQGHYQQGVGPAPEVLERLSFK